MLPSSRIQSLYSDFRNLIELNPDGYRANVNVWKDYLMNTVWKDDVVIRGGSILLRKLTINTHGPPKSIDVVIDQLISEERILPRELFQRGNELTWSLWLKQSLTGLVMDTSYRSRANNDAKYLREDDYVNMDNLKRVYNNVYKVLEENVMSKATRYTDLVFRKQELYDLLKEAIEGKEAYDVLLVYMQKYERIVLVGPDIVKVVDPYVKSLVKNFASDTITEDDENIAELCNALNRLEKHSESLTAHIKDTTKLLKGSINADASKEVQKRYLKMKRLAESNLGRVLTQLSNLMTIKDHIDKSVDNIHLAAALKGSVLTLESINAQIGTVDEVEKLLDRIDDEAAEVDKLNTLLSTSTPVDEDELDKELAQMETDMKNEQQQENKLLNKLSKLEVNDLENPKPKVASPVKKDEKRREEANFVMI
ncbi:HBR375Wp [Eremothecium sinecaudum]|uniref:HBR375Wp n=1 Tax=Eremothecium sinecaudum TaxID=45286 RepID=A0A120K1E9_9SACH|nr:HBR375Wp [Eremothecium sinecaudum]AMD19276.1 HBR375Wp [Eremothecium sinecaudum]